MLRSGMVMSCFLSLPARAGIRASALRVNLLHGLVALFELQATGKYISLSVRAELRGL